MSNNRVNTGDVKNSILNTIVFISQNVKQTMGVCEASINIDSILLKAILGQISLVKALKYAEALKLSIN